jgi:integrase
MPSAKTGTRFKLTTASVRERCRPPEEGEVTAGGRQVLYRFYWDTELRGFALVVGARTRTFIVQKDVRGRSVRVTIGRLGAWTVDQARKRARELVVQMDSGVDPNAREREESARGVTLAEAVEMHLSTMRAKSCAPRSLQVIRDECRRHLSDWLQRPLGSITRNECAQRHERITERSGRYAANRVLQSFRACYNTAARRMDDLPPNPVVGVTFNKVRRRREPVPWAQLPAWRARVDAIANPIRRDLQLFVLLTGLRSADARTVRWEHVDFERGTVHRPKPKGGEDRAFTVPVSRAVLEILQRRRDENALLYPDDHGWVFPSKDMDGHVSHVAQAKEQRYEMGRKVEHLPSPHRLRDTFASAAHEARVHPLDLKVLMNHTLPAGDDVTEGYIRPSIEHLRGAVEQVAAFLLGKMQQGA